MTDTSIHTASKTPAETPTANITRSEPKVSPSTSFRPDIEGLRAIAVLLVVAAHAKLPFIEGGFVGVDVFFVISGFLITTLLLKELTRTGTISISSFYARRATRLLPASALVLVVTLIAAWVWLPITRIAAIGADALSASFYAINYRLAFTGTDYLNADAPPSPLQHFWSLAVEEQFYVVWPLLLIVIALIKRSPTGYNRSAVATALGIILIGSLAISIVSTPESPSWAYFGLQTRAWELAVGALVAVFAVSLHRLPGTIAAAMTWTGVAMIIVAGFTFTESTVFPGYAAVLPVAGTGFVIAGGVAAGKFGANSLLKLAPFQFIGKISYSLYLWHWPFLLIAPVAFNQTDNVLFNLGAVTAALVCAWLSLHLVENPIRHRKTLKFNAWRGITVGGGLTAVTGLCAVLAFTVLPNTGFKGEPAIDTASAVDRSGTDTLADIIDDSSNTTVIPSNLSPNLINAEEDRPVIYPENCNLEITDPNTNPPICFYGDTEADRTVVLFGDSHAAQWFPAMDEIGKDKGWRLIPLTRSGCAVAEIDIYHKVLGRNYTECSQWRQNVFDTIDDLNPELVITTSINGHQALDTSDEKIAPDKQDDAVAQGWETTFDHLQDNDTDVTYIIDTPNFKEPVPDCLAENPEDIDDCSVPLDESKLRPERTEQIIDLAENRSINVIDPTDWFCTESECPPVVGNVLVSRDSNHVTTVYMEIIAPLVATELPQL